MSARPLNTVTVTREEEEVVRILPVDSPNTLVSSSKLYERSLENSCQKQSSIFSFMNDLFNLRTYVKDYFDKNPNGIVMLKEKLKIFRDEN